MTDTSTPKRDAPAQALEGETSSTNEAVAPAEAPDGEASSTNEPAAPPAKKPGRLQQLVVEYGAIALVVHLTLFALTLIGFAIAISAGFQTEGAGEETGVWVAAYVASQLTKPIRLPLVVVLTPIVATVWHRIRGTTPPSKSEP